jgi:hypothetical protein
MRLAEMLFYLAEHPAHLSPNVLGLFTHGSSKLRG